MGSPSVPGEAIFGSNFDRLQAPGGLRTHPGPVFRIKTCSIMFTPRFLLIESLASVCGAIIDTANFGKFQKKSRIFGSGAGSVDSSSVPT